MCGDSVGVPWNVSLPPSWRDVWGGEGRSGWRSRVGGHLLRLPQRRRFHGMEFRVQGYHRGAAQIKEGQMGPLKPSGTACCWVTASLTANVNVFVFSGNTTATVRLVKNNPRIPSTPNQLGTVTWWWTGSKERCTDGTCLSSLLLSIKSFFFKKLT